MKFTKEYMAVLESARIQLVACKWCGECAHAIEHIELDKHRVATYCSKYDKDVTRKTGYWCDSFIAKGE